MQQEESPGLVELLVQYDLERGLCGNDFTVFVTKDAKAFTFGLSPDSVRIEDP